MQERFRLDPEAALDRLRKFLRIAERRVDAARTTRRDEVHHVVEIAMVAQRELRVDLEPPREVEHRTPSADIRGPQPDRPDPRHAVVERRTEAPKRAEVGPRGAELRMRQRTASTRTIAEPNTCPASFSTTRNPFRSISLPRGSAWPVPPRRTLRTSKVWGVMIPPDVRWSM